MLTYPKATTREEKMRMVKEITKRLLAKYKDQIAAIGVYGSVALRSDGPYSDIEMHVITHDGVSLDSYEFIYDRFKIELSMKQKGAFMQLAKMVDDTWAITAGAFINVVAIYDPEQVFEEVKGLPLQLSADKVKGVMRTFMIWEPYETVAKIRNNYQRNNMHYLPLGAKDLTWQTLKLIGLANKQYFSTRARVYEESLKMPSQPVGYEALVRQVMEGNLEDSKLIYELCEKLWTGLNAWYGELGIEYVLKELPF